MNRNNDIVVSVKGATWSGPDMELAIEAYTMEAGNLRNALAISDVIESTDNQAMAYAKCIGAAYADKAVQTRVVGAREEFYSWLTSKKRSLADARSYIKEQGGAFAKQEATWIGIVKLVNEVRNQVIMDIENKAINKSTNKKAA